jgi:hypothetical protein
MTPSLASPPTGNPICGVSAARMGFGVALNISTTIYGFWGQVQTTSWKHGDRTLRLDGRCPAISKSDNGSNSCESAHGESRRSVRRAAGKPP